MPDPKRQFATRVVRDLRDAGYTALWAGGCVRDLLLGIEPKDYDVATDCVPEKVREIFGHRRTQAVGASFGVILLRGPREAGHVEIATFRTEGSYLDGRRPSTVEFSTPEEDAQRRDFTINGMFYDPLEHTVLDFVGGEKDLGDGVVRAIGDPHDRMREDKLRMLRAVRFAATLDFELDATTADAIREMAAELLVVSAERIAAELRRMLVDQHRKRAMELARDVELLPQIVPELRPLLGHISPPLDKGGTKGGSPPHEEWEITLQMLQLLHDCDFELAFAALLQGIAQDREEGSGLCQTKAARTICNRLRLSNDETDKIAWLLEQRYAIDEAASLPLHRLKRLVVHRYFDDLLAFVRAERLARNLDLSPVLFCEEYVRDTPTVEIDPPELITGDDLISMNLPPGPRFKEILTAVRDAQLDGEIGAREEAIALVQRLQGEGGDDKQGERN